MAELAPVGIPGRFNVSHFSKARPPNELCEKHLEVVTITFGFSLDAAVGGIAHITTQPETGGGARYEVAVAHPLYEPADDNPQAGPVTFHAQMMPAGIATRTLMADNSPASLGLRRETWQNGMT